MEKQNTSYRQSSNTLKVHLGSKSNHRPGCPIKNKYFSLLPKNFPHNFPTQSPKALIISTKQREKNLLRIILLRENFLIDQIKTKKELLNCFLQPAPRYDVVIISDYFNETGFSIITTYFKKFAKTSFFIYLGKNQLSEYQAYGFDAAINPACISKNLSKFYQLIY